MQLHHLGIEPDEAHLFQRLANRILVLGSVAAPVGRPCWPRTSVAHPACGRYGISGDLPIVMVRIDEVEDLDIVRQLLRAHEYWRLKLLDVDLVILNEHGASYVQNLQDSLEAVVRASQSSLGSRRSSGPRRRVHPARRPTLRRRSDAAAWRRPGRCCSAGAAALADQVIRLERPDRIEPPIPPPKPSTTVSETVIPRLELEFFNGLGGFADGGREYVTILGPGQSTPAPWLNVIANTSFGFQVSESGSGYTWSGNSRENQLTPQQR